MIFYEKFRPIKASSKFSICGLPLRLDTYRTCTFDCKYCFSIGKIIMNHKNIFKIADLEYVEKRLKRIFIDKKIIKTNFLDFLLSNRITWHCGGFSDPFQPIEKELKITSKLLEITNKYGIHILFSTKTDDVYDWTNLNPDLHSFQLSITNLLDRQDIEPNVPSIKNRIEFFKELKKRNFKVGIRIQPFIPGVSDENIIEVFKDADYFSIEGLKLISQNKEQKNFMLKTINLEQKDFINMGLLNLKQELRLKMYAPLLKKLEEYNIPYSIADNDLHYMTKSKCCCGEHLIEKSTNFNDTAIFFKTGKYDLDMIKENIKDCEDCNVGCLFNSSKKSYFMTMKEYFDKKVNNKFKLFSQKSFNKNINNLTKFRKEKFDFFCPKCKIKTEQYGKKDICKKCYMLEFNKKNYEKNKEKIKEQTKKYYYNNYEKGKEKRLEYNLKNPRKKYHKEYYEKHKKELNKKMNDNYYKNKEKLKNEFNI